jgi:putative DNA primase/helicase
MIIGSELGIGYDPRQHAAYAASWIQILEDQPFEIFR